MAALIIGIAIGITIGLAIAAILYGTMDEIIEKRNKKKGH